MIQTRTSPTTKKSEHFLTEIPTDGVRRNEACRKCVSTEIASPSDRFSDGIEEPADSSVGCKKNREKISKKIIGYVGKSVGIPANFSEIRRIFVGDYPGHIFRWNKTNF